ncbi:hypothetical protein N0V83_004118 [Neocucurbitaria cava]|uniref:Uncharacterized protein n=1 Tax=Neocucurbitaria cava TaxID=798079 RepID=A0A9W8YC82_9PLEO|nr:hypothetical protein N0V83_004118 [Neocucurbitaria cava]
MTDEEILVHISTPATKQNDNLYQSLSRAYLEFEPQRRYPSEAQHERHGQTQPNTSRLDPATIPDDEHLSLIAAEPSISSSNKDSYGSFPSHLSSDGAAKDYNLTGTQPRHGSLEDDSIPTSSRLAQLERIHMNWKEKSTSKSSPINSARRLRRTSRNSEDADTAFIEDTQVAVQGLQSQLQETYSTTSEDTSDDDDGPKVKSQDDRLPADDDSRQDVDRITAEVLASARPTANAVSNILIANLQEEPRSDDRPKVPLPASKAGVVNPNYVDGHRASLKSLHFSKLPENAFPPAPQLSIARPGSLPSQITRYLTAIKRQNPKRFEPSKKLRVPKSDDRGFWSLDCSSWPKRLQYEFWSSICEHVLSGRLGWGTTLHREPSTQVLGQVKLYCWGEVVEHMWLLLWLCSKGKISGSRSNWYDADGIAVFEVP